MLKWIQMNQVVQFIGENFKEIWHDLKKTSQPIYADKMAAVAKLAEEEEAAVVPAAIG